MVYYDIEGANIEEVLNRLNVKESWVLKRRFRKKAIRYFNVPMAFDIETTSTYQNGEKVAFMYEWTMAINEDVFIGRTWEQFNYMLDIIINTLKLDDMHRLILWVHNLSFEFSFLMKRFKWSSVFALDSRKPVRAITTEGIEFRCSYILSAYALGSLAKNLHSHKIEKLKGDLDYSLVRTCITPMSKDELQYCINDVLIVIYYIQEQLEEYGNVTKLPLTNTGRVREYCRNQTLFKKHGKRTYINKFYSALMKVLTIEPDEYRMLNRAFMGGFVHGNNRMVGTIHYNTASEDFSSAYPAVMINEPRYPSSKGIQVFPKSIEHFYKFIRKYCCVFNITFYDLKEKINFEHYLSGSKCIIEGKRQYDNGRIVYADKLSITITEVDFEIIEKCYKFSKIEVGEMWVYKRGYLPTQLVKSILKLYKDKTELKGVVGSEVEYMRSKGMLNSVPYMAAL